MHPKLPEGTRLVHIDPSKPMTMDINQGAVDLVARQFSAFELLSLSAGGHGDKDITRMIQLAYWPRLTSRSSVLVAENDPTNILSAIFCIPFYFMDADLVERIVLAIRGNDTATLDAAPSGLVRVIKADKHPEIIWLMAECDRAAMVSTCPTAAKFAQYVAHDQALKDGEQRWIEEFGLIASETDSPRGSMTGAMTVLLKEMWQSGVKMAIGFYNNYSASVAIRSGGVQLCKIEHRNAKSLAQKPGEPNDAPRFKFMQTELDSKRGVPAEFIIVHDLEVLAENF